MFYPEFNITIEDAFGVCPVGEDTQLLARVACTLEGLTCLEIGTGTGFVALALAKKGWNCTATDISENAVHVAKENAERNKVQLTLIQGDLFETVSGRFDLIVFNPPYGSSSNPKFAKVLEYIKSLIPRDNEIIAGLTYALIKKRRRLLIERFLKEAPSYVQSTHTILLLLHQEELTLCDRYNPRIVGSSKDMRAVLFSLSQ